MASEIQPEWLPPDWIEVKDKLEGKVEYYHNAYTGQTIFTKEDVIRYISMAKISNSPPQQMDEGNDCDTKNKTVVVKSEKSPEWLPRGWTVELRSRDSGKQIKCFVHPEGKLRFYSKPQVFRYLETGNSVPATQEGPYVVNETGENFSPRYDASQIDEIPEWLPQGWTMEIKVKESGANKVKKIKCYIAPRGGRKCYSKPQVFDYLKTLNSSPAGQERVQQRLDHLSGDKCSSKADVLEECKSITVKRSITKRKKAGDNSPSLENNQDIERGQADGLPPGWIRETRTRKSGSLLKKDPYYIDPSSGYEFRSKRDALRYLETGNIKDCVCRPQRVVVNDTAHIYDTELINEDISPNVVTESGEKSSQGYDASQRDGIPEWLPQGWTFEMKLRGSGASIGKKIKCYIAPGSGHKCYSKPQVYDYLKTLNNSPSEQERPNVVNESGEKSSPGYDASQIDGIPEWLPQGWTMEVKVKRSGTSKGKKIKCYIAPGGGHKCYSKPQVYDYLKTLNNGQVQQRADHLNGDKCSSEPDVFEDCESISIKRNITEPKKAGDKSPSLENNNVIETGPADGFPPGWIREIRTRKSGALLKKDQYFIDISSGYKFRSRRDALRYLETGNIEDCVERPQKEVVNDTAHINDAKSIKEDILVVEMASVDGLPPGWIKEVRSKKIGSRIRKDPYFIDPLSGYEFRSKPDALRYIETGDINKCAIKPKRKDNNGTESISKDNSEKLLAGGKIENSGERTGDLLNKSKNKTPMPPHPPGGRSSKRLKGAEPEMTT